MPKIFKNWDKDSGGIFQINRYNTMYLNRSQFIPELHVAQVTYVYNNHFLSRLLSKCVTPDMGQRGEIKIILDSLRYHLNYGIFIADDVKYPQNRSRRI